MVCRRRLWVVLVLIVEVLAASLGFKDAEGAIPHRILLDTDVDTDDLFALLYLLKQDRSEFKLEAVTVSANAWTDAGHAVNHVYDILYMMGRDDIAVGVGGEGGVQEDGAIELNVGGYLPIIEQGMATAGYCRYRQVIPLGSGGRLDKDTDFGFRKGLLPQGSRKYSPLEQPTAQEVLIDKISAGPINVILIGSHTNFAIFLMANPHLKKNVKHIYIMGGGVRSKNPTDCCPENASSTCIPGPQCGTRGNLYTDYNTNPYAEFNMFADPFAAYQVFHAGIPTTLVSLDATNTIPITKEFFETFEKSQFTYEAQYCFKTLKIVRDTWFDNNFYTTYFMWDSFLSGVATSMMRNGYDCHGENEFAEMEYMNITVITSNEPYGISDGSNPFFDGRQTPKFNLTEGGVHSGHVQRALRDTVCFVKNGQGKCKDGYTEEVIGVEGVRVLVATKAKPNKDTTSSLNREFFRSFLDALNQPEQRGRFNFTSQFLYYREVTYKPNFEDKRLGKPVVFDMDMSAGDFLALFYLLKVPVEVIDLKAIIVSPTGWADAATIDVIYDLLHMMGRDDIPVGLGEVYANNQSDPIYSGVGRCEYFKAIPHGSGGLLDSDTLYGLARDLPRSPRRYTAENSVEHGAPRDTDHPELRQPLALEVWNSTLQSLKPGSKVTILTNGPLTNLAKVLLSLQNFSSLVQDIYIVGGHISQDAEDKGNVFSIPSNKYAEFNMFLDPLAAKTVFESDLKITLLPLSIQRKVDSFSTTIERLNQTNGTPEVLFSIRLLSTLYALQQKSNRYQHMGTFLGEVVGAVVLGGDSSLNVTMQVQRIKVLAQGVESLDGKMLIDKENGKLVDVIENLGTGAYYNLFAFRLGQQSQSAKIGSFEEQKERWSRPPTIECIGKFDAFGNSFF